MVVRFVLWSLADSKTSVAELRRYLADEAVDRFAEVEGLRFKAWISDEATERWGAIYVWESPTSERDTEPGPRCAAVDRMLREATAPWEGRYPDVAVGHALVHGDNPVRDQLAGCGLALVRVAEVVGDDAAHLLPQHTAISVEVGDR